MGTLFNKIELRNFGPYLGINSLEFGITKPIVIIHGQNMAGKTSLLNAIRWVLYGHALNRFGKPVPLKYLINQEDSDSGNWTMSVKLWFEVDGNHYELERFLQRKDTSIPPRKDTDFEIKLFLQKNEHHFNSGSIQPEINRILPELISRFFLFDGELLNEYETLLASAEQQSIAIKDSIEHILGVPALVNAVADIKIILNEAARRQRTLAKQDSKAKEFGATAERFEAEITTHSADLTELIEHRTTLLRRQSELNDILQVVAGYETDVLRSQEIEDKIQSLREEQKLLLQENRDKLADAWLDLLQPSIEQKLVIFEEENMNQINNLQKVERLRSELHNIEHLLNLGKCPVCGQSTSGVQSAEFQARKNELEQEITKQGFDQRRLEQVSDALRKLRAIKPSRTLEIVVKNETRLLRIGVELVDLELKLDEINDRLKGHDRNEIAHNRHDYDETTKELGVVEKSIATKESQINDLQAQATRNRTMISKVSGPEMQRANREVQLCEGLISLFEHTKDRLRDELRKSVEQEATDIFLHLTTDKSYKGLRINENYGLTILDENGREIPVRSAGAEQIVALSLIGALNRNAIRKGPIVMDTPFGRLDHVHRENILKFIPTMAEQVTLLVHSGEINRERDLQSIQDYIEKEYTIRRVSLRQSELVSEMLIGVK